MCRHIHAELIDQYAKDWKETHAPWERWESYDTSNKRWTTFTDHPAWNRHDKYRRKPRTIIINGHEVPEPVREPLEEGEQYYVVDLKGIDESPTSWCDNFMDLSLLAYGLIHLTPAAADLHRKALLSFTV